MGGWIFIDSNSVSTYKIRQVYILIVHVYKLAKIISDKKTMLFILSTYN